MFKTKNLVDDSDSEPEICINKEYAEKYENWRKKEEYQRLKSKYGDNVLSESSEFSGTDSETDSDQDLLNEQLNQEIFDEDFFRVYGALKSKDPRIYDEKFSFVDKRDQTEASSSTGLSEKEKGKKSKDKKMTLVDYHMTLMKERGGKTEEDDQDEEESSTGISNDPSYYEKLQNIREGFKQIIDQSDSESDSEEMLKKSDKKVAGKTGEAKKVIKKSVLDSQDEDIAFLKDYWSKDTVDENEKFIRDFILKKKYIDKPLKVVSSSDRLIGSSKDDTNYFFGNMPENDDEDDEDEDELKKDMVPTDGTAKFRFQEEGAAEIKRYPRVVDSSRDLSGKDEKAKKRKEKRERKKKEKDEDLMRFTQLKKEQELERVKKLKEISKNKKIDETDPTLEALVDEEHEFDPDKYDEFMRKIYDNDYYKEGEEEDVKKPEFDFIEGVDDTSGESDNEQSEKGEKDDNDDEDESEEEVNPGDSDHEDEQVEDLSSLTCRKRRRLRKKKLRQRLRKAKDIDSLPDFEDVIGKELPVKFKYRQVMPNDFGLSIEEILLADDKELNRWASLKTTVAFRDESEEMHDVRKFNSKRNDLKHKQRILKSLFKEEAEHKESKKKKKRGKKKAKTVSQLQNEEEEKKEEKEVDDDDDEQVISKDEADQDVTEVNNSSELPNEQKGTKRKSKNDKKNSRKRKRVLFKSNSGVDIERLKAYGFSKNEMKKKKLL